MRETLTKLVETAEAFGEFLMAAVAGYPIAAASVVIICAFALWFYFQE